MQYPPALEEALRKEGIDPRTYKGKSYPYIRVNPRSELALLEHSELEMCLGMNLEGFPWTPHYRVRGKRHLNKDPYFLMGSYYRQDLASAAPVYALAPEGGELIADVCSAPGGKTFLIADWAPVREVFALDSSSRRFARLQQNIAKYGVTNVRAVLGDASSRDYAMGLSFDRILVDAPCPGEGNTSRLYGKHLRKWYSVDDWWQPLLELNYRILKTAFENLRDNGVLVYSTCTFQTEFNEELVLRFLEEVGGRLAKVSIPNFLLRTPHHESMYRIYPRDNRTKGLFFAKIVKN